jgi:hypothetical protein
MLATIRLRNFSLFDGNIKIDIQCAIALLYYGCETWYLTLRKSRRLGVFDTVVLTKVFGPTMEEVTVGWRKFHNGEVCE